MTDYTKLIERLREYKDYIPAAAEAAEAIEALQEENALLEGTLESRERNIAEMQAENERLTQDRDWPNSAPYRAVQLCEFEANPQATEPAWSPIETAPKGEKGCSWMLLAWGPEEDKSTGYGMNVDGKFYASATFYCLGQDRLCQMREIEVNPTHWMPLPAAPEAPMKDKSPDKSWLEWLHKHNLLYNQIN